MTPPCPRETSHRPETYHVSSFWAVLWTAIGAVIVGVTFSLTGAHFTTGSVVGSAVGGLFLCSGLFSFVRPPVFAQFDQAGVTFRAHHYPLIRWDEILAVHAGPTEVRDPRENSTTLLWRHPVVFHLKPGTAIARHWATSHLLASHADGSSEFLVDTSQCPIPTDDFIARLAQRLPHGPGAAAHLAPSRGFTTPPPASLNRRLAPAVIITLAGLCVIGMGISLLFRERAWPWLVVVFGATFALWGAALVRHQLGRPGPEAGQKSSPKSSRSRV